MWDREVSAMNLWKKAARIRLAWLVVGLAIPATGLSQDKTAARAPAVVDPVAEIVIVSAPRPPLEPGELVDLGLTYDIGVFRESRTTPVRATPVPVLRPGEGPGGTALLNPNRAYRSGWDSTLVPGYSMPYSNSRNDYAEGRTIAYPPGEGRQRAPGAPPMMTNDGGDVPRAPGTTNGGPPLMGPSMNPPTMAGGSETPRVADVHDVPRVSYDPNLPPPSSAPPAPPKP
jgi:hypothetical protein